MILLQQVLRVVTYIFEEHTFSNACAYHMESGRFKFPDSRWAKSEHLHLRTEYRSLWNNEVKLTQHIVNLCTNLSKRQENQALMDRVWLIVDSCLWNFILETANESSSLKTLRGQNTEIRPSSRVFFLNPWLTLSYLGILQTDFFSI